MYKLSEEQKNTLLYTLERLTVTGPDQGGMLCNAAAILRKLAPVPEYEEKKEEQ